MHVSIVGLGPTAVRYMDFCRGLGGRHKYCDQTWVINAFGSILENDLIFHMDDVRTQQIRAAADPDSHIAAMLAWLKVHPGPIMTSIAHPDFPGLVEFPLEEALKAVPGGYFNSTAAYAVAYAIIRGATKISLFGLDFTYPDKHDAEKGRACVEFWLGVAASRGIVLAMPKETTLMDAMYPPAQRLYGYDFVDVDIQWDESGRAVTDVRMKEHGRVPTAETIEAAYDHSAHPNGLMREVHACAST
jgi:hypothetical protein